MHDAHFLLYQHLARAHQNRQPSPCRIQSSLHLHSVAAITLIFRHCATMSTIHIPAFPLNMPPYGHMMGTSQTPIICSAKSIPSRNAQKLTHQGTLIANLVVLRLCFPFLPECRRKCLRIRPRRDNNILVCCNHPFLSIPSSKSHRRSTHNLPALHVHIVRKLLSCLRPWGGRATSHNQGRTRGILWLFRYQLSFHFLSS